MRVTVLAAGSRGDVQPYLALAWGLHRQGHTVRLAANSNFATLAAGYGLDFFPLKVDSSAFVREKQVQKWLESDNIFKLALNTGPAISPTLDRILRDAWEACQGTEAIIYHSFTMPTAFYIGELLGVPCLPGSIYPTPTREHPALPLNTRRRLPGIYNLISHRMLELIGWQLYRPSARAFLSKDLKIPISGPYRRLRKARRPIVCGYSRTVLPEPADLPDHVHITGYWTLEPAPGWKPDPKLLDFLQSGAPPVFVGFASMGNPLKAPETTDIVVQALAQAHVRGVLVSGWSGLGLGTKLSDNVTVVENVPYSWLLPQMSAIVHHGGAGTTGAGLRAGVPNIVIPHFSDNYFWASRVAALGAGPEPIPRKRLTAERLAAAITQAVGDRNMRQRVAAIGQHIRAEDGVARAIDVFYNYIG